VPTPAASTLADRVREALNGIASALDAFEAAAPPLRVTAPPTFATRWLAPLLPRYTGAGTQGIELDVSTEVRNSDAFDVAIRTGLGGWSGLDEYRLAPVEATPMLSPALLKGRVLSSPQQLADFDILPHPDWERWFAEAQCEMPRDMRFLNVDYPTHELNANAALAGTGVAFLSPSLFRSLVTEGQLVAPFVHVVSGPAWHFALVRGDDARRAPRDLCAWLVEQAAELADDVPTVRSAEHGSYAPKGARR
jgi:LysR family glycine cleavage system transcriptional activator